MDTYLLNSFLIETTLSSDDLKVELIQSGRRCTRHANEWDPATVKVWDCMV